MPKRILYLDPFSGISGDMLVGALLDLGLDLAKLQHELGKLNLRGYRLASKKVMRGAIAGTKFDVLPGEAGRGPGDAGRGTSGPSAAAQVPFGHELKVPHRDASAYAGPRTKEETLYTSPGTKFGGDEATEPTRISPPSGHAHGHEHAHAHDHGHEHGHDASHGHAHTNFAQIRALIEASELSERVKAQSLRAFACLAEAEGRMHGMEAEQVGFHEAGAVDSIVDFVGACIGLELLGIDEVRSGPVALGGEGGGYIACEHGRLPVPAFATLELMKGLPIRPCPVNKELTTPTGAALLKALVKPEHFGPLPPMNIERLGYGAGTRNDPAIAVPNLLRAALGELDEAGAYETDSVVEVQANIDDTTPEVLGYALERLMAAGALDAFCAPLQMKKSRPATLLTALAPQDKLGALLDVLFRETSTFGVRYETKMRAKLAREIERALTPWGEVHVKIGRRDGVVMSAHPEYEDCKALAEKHGVPLRHVIAAALSLYAPRGE
ncbi:MAG: nickel pincer cofactor biosynthesis protein LarC [Planctomycetes bacterium]|nr:nickel pincer cofactor biosynthesis protein LarC [Planctomycetota bacterium]